MIALAITATALLFVLLIQKSGLLRQSNQWNRCPCCRCYWTAAAIEPLVLMPGHTPDSIVGDEPEAMCPHCAKEEQDHAV